MTDILNKTLRSSFLILAFSLMFSFNAKAQTCGTPPTCESLGYILGEDDCINGSIKCPFDLSKVYCTKLYVEVGDILYSDMTIASKVVSSKKPVGIVISSEKRLAVALKPISITEWGGKGHDIPGLKNYTVTSNKTDAENDFNGQANTDIILEYGKDNGITYKAAEACANYAPEGMTKGKWFLPAAGEMKLIASSASKISENTKLVGGSILPAGMTSNEIDGNNFITNYGGIPVPLTKGDLSGNAATGGVTSYPVYPMIHF